MYNKFCILALFSLGLINYAPIKAQKVDYSMVSVQEEAGTDFMKITKESDYVVMPMVVRGSKQVKWSTNRILAIPPSGDIIAYLSKRNNATNIFVKDINKQGSSQQRTNRSNVVDFSYSPDGKYLCFSETRGKTNQIFRTDATNGYVCRQITNGDKDYSPIYSPDLKRIFFTRLEQRGSSIWGYDIANNFLSSYTQGMNPCTINGGKELLIVRTSATKRNEIWKVNYDTGVEECIISDPNRSFSSPIVSPNGNWVLFVGEGIANNAKGKPTYYNTDLFVCRLDGTELTQLTYHPADDLSPVWSIDGKYIYFISQRGDSNGIANIWKMTFNY